MKDNKDYYNATQDELYDYKEVVGNSSWERIEYLTAWLKSQTRKELEELVQLYQWGE